MKQLLFFLLTILPFSLSAQNITGRTVTDGETPLRSVLAVNIRTGDKTLSDTNGNFVIPALANDEIRFVKAGYQRSSVTVSSAQSSVFVNITPAYHEIEEVKVNPLKLSGDLNRDAGLLSKADKKEQLQREIGLPTTPDKPREKPAELVDDVLTPLAFGVINIQGIYDLVSGDARRKKHLYELEDQQSDVAWIRNRIGNDYFIKAGIPAKRIGEFIEFSFTQNSKVRQYAQAKNLSGVVLEMENAFPIFISRLNKKL